MKPPFPAGAGLYGCSMNVTNVETVSVIPMILRRVHKIKKGIVTCRFRLKKQFRNEIILH